MGKHHTFKAGKRATKSHYTQVKMTKAAKGADARQRLAALKQAQADREQSARDRRETRIDRLVSRFVGLPVRMR